MREIRSPINRLGKPTGNHYDLIIDENDHMLLNEYDKKRDFR